MIIRPRKTAEWALNTDMALMAVVGSTIRVTRLHTVPHRRRLLAPDLGREFSRRGCRLERHTVLR